MIPLVNAKVARTPARLQAQSWWQGPVRWIVAVLALAATLDAAYLTWTSLSHSTVAGCDGMSLANCDLVLASPWSKWLFLPVAFGGALCYGGIFALSLLADRLTDEPGRWAGTALILLSLLAAAAGVWFTFVQIVLIGAFCPHCLATHLCGMVIAGLVVWAYVRHAPDSAAISQSRGSLAAIPAGGGRRPSSPRPALAPSFAGAVAGAFGLLFVLIAVQVWLPPKTFEATKPNLEQSIDMTVAADTPPATDDLTPAAQTHVVNRVADGDESVEPAAADDQDATGGSLDGTDVLVDASADSAAENSVAAGAIGDDAGEETDEPAPAQPKAPALAREVKFLNNRVRINSYHEAVLGSPEAEFMVIEMMDYTCPHCREMHKSIKRAKAHYGDKLGVVIMPVPLEMECNKLVQTTSPTHRGACRLARLSLSVAQVDPEAFADFHNWLLDDEKNPPSAVQTLDRAWKLVEQKELSRTSNGDEIKQRMEKYINLYGALSKEYNTKEKPFGLPVLIVGDTVMTGKYESDGAMFEAWDKALGVDTE